MSTSVPDPNTKFSGSALARRRLTTRPTESEMMKPTKCVPRCLFGPPNPNYNPWEAINEILEKRMNGFKDRWNFDPNTGLPCPPAQTSPSQGPEGEVKPRFVWTPISASTDAQLLNQDGIGKSAEVNQTTGTTRKENSPTPPPKRLCMAVPPKLKQRQITGESKLSILQSQTLSPLTLTLRHKVKVVFST